MLTEWDLGLLHKAKHLGVEAQGLVLVVDQNTHHVDLHQ
jgi:hypothetical protein